MTWELILDGYSESSYSATPRFAAARLPWFSLVKQKLLNTPEAVKGYEDADKELEMVEMLYEMRE
ncbi:hypothetical protein R1C91_28325, partial [Escherichia coli]